MIKNKLSCSMNFAHHGISILIPVNSTRYLYETLQSVADVDYPKECLELLVVLDGITPDELLHITESISGLPEIKIIRSTSKGIINALNSGLINSKYEFIARLDHDDRIISSRLKVQVSELIKRNLVAIGGQVQLIDSNGKKIGYAYYPVSDLEICFSKFLASPLAHPATLFRKSAVLEVGMYRDVLPEDWDLWLRLSQKYRIGNAKHLVIAYRIHTSQLSRNKDYDSNLAISRMRSNHKKTAKNFFGSKFFSNAVVRRIQDTVFANTWKIYKSLISKFILPMSTRRRGLL